MKQPYLKKTTEKKTIEKKAYNKMTLLKKRITNKITTFNKILLAFLSFIPLMSFGQIDFESYLRLRTLSRQVQDSDQRTFSSDQSFRLKGSLRPSEIFETHFWLLSYTFFGEDSKNPADFIKLYGFGKWFFTKELSLRMGRVPYETSFHQIMSSNFEEPYPYVFDGLFINYSSRLINLDAFGAYMPNPYIGATKQTSLKYGAGIFLDIYSVSEFLNHVNLHLVYLWDSLSQTTSQTTSQKTTRYGIAIDGNLTNLNLDYKLIGIAHGSGFKFKSDQNMYHTELAYSQLEWSGSRFFVGYHSDTENYNPWFYDRYKNAGLLNLFFWGNLTYFYVGYEASFANLFDFKLIFHNMSSTNSGNIRFAPQGFALRPTDSSIEDKEILEAGTLLGREIDVSFSKKINKEFELNLVLGVFISSPSTEDLFKEASPYTSIKLTGIYEF